MNVGPFHCILKNSCVVGFASTQALITQTVALAGRLALPTRLALLVPVSITSPNAKLRLCYAMVLASIQALIMQTVALVATSALPTRLAPLVPV